MLPGIEKAHHAFEDFRFTGIGNDFLVLAHLQQDLAVACDACFRAASGSRSGSTKL